MEQHTPNAGSAFQTLVDIMARLRGPQGCPWDREQTLESLRAFLLEETHEVLDAIDRGDTAALRGEIGDLIFEGVFLAQISADAGDFTVTDSLHSIAAKLIRRHPHIFDPAGRPLDTPGEVHQQWEQIKAREQSDAGERRSVLKGLSKSLPSLLRAYEIGTRVAAVGFDWAKSEDVVAKIEEEVAELRRAAASEGPARMEEEMGDLLFSIGCARRTRSSRRASRPSKTTCTRRDDRCMTQRWRRCRASGRVSRRQDEGGPRRTDNN